MAPWPTARELLALVPDQAEAVRQIDELAYQWATEVLFEVRKQRSEAKQALKVPIARVLVRALDTTIGLMPIVEQDLRSALRVKAFDVAVGEPQQITVEGYELADGS